MGPVHTRSAYRGRANRNSSLRPRRSPMARLKRFSSATCKRRIESGGAKGTTSYNIGKDCFQNNTDNRAVAGELGSRAATGRHRSTGRESVDFWRKTEL